MSVIDQIPEPHRSTFVAVLEAKNPDLLHTLRNSAVPTQTEWETVEETFIDALSEHYGPGHEPEATGKRIDNALGAFMTHWPNDQLLAYRDRRRKERSKALDELVRQTEALGLYDDGVFEAR